MVFRGHFGSFSAIFGPFWAILGHFGPFWAILGHFRAISGTVFRAISGTVFGHYGGFLKPAESLATQARGHGRLVDGVRHQAQGGRNPALDVARGQSVVSVPPRGRCRIRPCCCVGHLRCSCSFVPLVLQRFVS